MTRSPFRRKTLLLHVLGASALLLGNTAMAQDTSDVTSLGIEEITVTAQKRAENLQEVPISISALSESDLERRGLQGVSDLLGTIPNVGGFQAPGSKGNVAISLRGASSGSPSNLSVDTATSIYIDGVVLGKQLNATLDQIELERVEVLRGPQGTLYGRNSTGGAVNFITRKPSGEFGGKLTGTAGSEGLWGVRASIDTGTLGTENEGLGTLKASFGGQTRKRDALYNNTVSGQDDLDEIDRQAYHVALRWEPTSDFTADYSYDHSEQDETNAIQVPVELTQINAAGLSRITALQGMIQAGNAAVNFGAGPLAGAVADPTFARWLGSANAMLAQFQGVGSDARPGHARADTPTYTEGDADGHNLTLAWRVNDLGVFGDVEFKSITGYRETKAHNVGDLDGFDNTIAPGGIGALNDSAIGAMYSFYAAQANPLAAGFMRLNTGKLWSLIDQYGGAFFTQNAKFDYEQLSEELQMVGSTERLQYAVGLYYFEDEGSFDNYRLAAQPVGGINSTAYDNDTEARAIYTQFTWTPAMADDRFHISGGFRRTEEEKGIKYRYMGDGGLFDGPNNTVDLTYTGALVPLATYGDKFDNKFSKDTGMVTLAYDLSDSTNVFLRWSTGYRSGGFNGEIYNNPFGEESMEQWELGLKSDLVDGKLRLNASVFQYTYDDLQVSTIRVVNNTVTSQIGNAGKADRWGAEVELQWSPIEDLLIGLNYAHLHGDFKEFPDVCAAGNANIGIQCLPAKDIAERPTSPDDSASLLGDWVFARTEWADFMAHVELFWQKKVYSSTIWTGTYGRGTLTDPALPVIYDPIELEERVLVNARLGIENIKLSNGTLRASLWGKNLFDDKYGSYGIGFASLGPVTRQFGEPRTWGVDLTWEF